MDIARLRSKIQENREKLEEHRSLPAGARKDAGEQEPVAASPVPSAGQEPESANGEEPVAEIPGEPDETEGWEDEPAPKLPEAIPEDQGPDDRTSGVAQGDGPAASSWEDEEDIGIGEDTGPGIPRELVADRRQLKRENHARGEAGGSSEIAEQPLAAGTMGRGDRDVAGAVRNTEEDETVSAIELLGFRAGGEEFAVRITSVEEILRMQPITPIPRMPSYLLGIASLRGRMIPVLDLKQKLSLSFMTPSSARILILGGEDSPFGLCVDSVIGVVRVQPDDIRPPLETLGEDEARFIEGVVMVDGGFISLLDLESVAQIEFGVEA